MSQVKVYVIEIPSYEEIKAVIKEDVTRYLDKWVLPIIDYGKLSAKYGVEYMKIRLMGTEVVVAREPIAAVTFEIQVGEYHIKYCREVELPEWICEVLKDEAKKVICGGAEEEEEEI